MKVYGHIVGYLHRWKLVGVGRFMARIHQILDIDRTPFLHSHPFHYISIVLKGSYSERVLQKDGSLKVIHRRRGSIVWRKANTFHRIDSVDQCTTLFLTWYLKGSPWTLRRHPKVATPKGYKNKPDGLYLTEKGWHRRENGMWYVARPTQEEARTVQKLSIFQNV